MDRGHYTRTEDVNDKMDHILLNGVNDGLESAEHIYPQTQLTAGLYNKIMFIAIQTKKP